MKIRNKKTGDILIGQVVWACNTDEKLGLSGWYFYGENEIGDRIVRPDQMDEYEDVDAAQNP